MVADRSCASFVATRSTIGSMCARMDSACKKASSVSKMDRSLGDMAYYKHVSGEPGASATGVLSNVSVARGPVREMLADCFQELLVFHVPNRLDCRGDGHG